MMVNKRRKLAKSFGSQDTPPKELTREETYQAFDYEIQLRLQCIAVLENTPAEYIKAEDDI